MLQRRFYHCPLMFVTIVMILAGGVALAQPLAVHIPDSNLHDALRETLDLPPGAPITAAEMRQLTTLNAAAREITDLAGLEYATNLTELRLGENPIADIGPLANLTQLRWLDLDRNLILNIGSLAGLTALETLDIRYNRVENLSPLANLTQLMRLILSNNRIEDVSPLATLTRLEILDIQANSVVDHSPLDGLSLTIFLYDQVCEMEPLPLEPRLANRDYPNVAGADWFFGQDSRIDLMFGGFFHMEPRPDGRLTGDFDRGLEERDKFIAANPNAVFLISLPMRGAPFDYWGKESPYWVRDSAGNFVLDGGAPLMDFTHPNVQDSIVQQAISVSKCGLFDGIVFDHWRDEDNLLEGYVSLEAQLQARLNILRRIRAATRPNFLIHVNSNTALPHTGKYINGLLMETGIPNWGRTPEERGEIVTEIEKTVVWAEENMREPRINAIFGEAFRAHEQPIGEQPRSANFQWVRLITTLSLTHADGYAMLQDLDLPLGDVRHWYDFWDADLGQPISEKQQLYQGTEGLYIREFTNGWAVYNHSGAAQVITLPAKVQGVASGLVDTEHTLPNLDGEMYLRVKPPNPADVNEDGVVNILDLILVAQAIGTEKSEPDVNGDGVINVFDLVMVAGAIGGGGAAPSADSLDLSNISAADVAKWLAGARGLGVGDANFQRGIRFLEGLLAALTPEETTLLPNFPNPFNPETWIPYRLAQEAEVTITIYDTKGTPVRRLALGTQAAGHYAERGRAAYWDGRNENGEAVASGIYIYQFRAGDYAASRRMVIVK